MYARVVVVVVPVVRSSSSSGLVVGSGSRGSRTS